MPCQHETVVQAQRHACGELEALGLPWHARAQCAQCGGLIELVWDAARCTVWERGATGIVFLREDQAPPAEPLPEDD